MITLLAIDWHPGIGDPTAMGWLTVGAYLATAFACLRAAAAEHGGLWLATRRAALPWSRRPTADRRALGWLVLAAIMFALGINKQIDLQTLFTELAKAMARREGWYEQRREVQTAFIAAVAIASAVSLALAIWLTRRELRVFRIPLVGLALLAGFVVIRAASFHHVDALIGAAPGGIRLNWLFELGGIAVVAWGSVRGRRPDGSPGPARHKSRAA